MESLRSKNCVPCEGDTPPLLASNIKELRKQVPQWEIVDWHRLNRRFKFKNFASALLFVNHIGALAEAEGHHPDISFGWGYAEITTFTHAINGLSENDFILAAKIDALPQGLTLPARRPARSPVCRVGTGRRNAGGSFGAGGNREKG